MAEHGQPLPGYALGGFDPDAGRSGQHRAEAPQRLPVPSLLRSLLSEHLDAGYAAAAAARDAAAPGASRLAGLLWRAVAVVLVAVVFAAAASQAVSTAPGVSAAQQLLAGNVRSARESAAELTGQRDELSTRVDDLQRTRLNTDSRGRLLLSQLDELTLVAGTTPVIGPGLTVTVADPGVETNLSDVSQQRISGSRQIILDRDLQLVVNSLWSNAAEAISIDDVRIGPNVTIRQAGGAILVDNTPITSPYTVLAIGSPTSLRDGFNRSPAMDNLRNLETLYGVRVGVSVSEGLALPATAIRKLSFAEQIGA